LAPQRLKLRESPFGPFSKVDNKKDLSSYFGSTFLKGGNKIDLYLTFNNNSYLIKCQLLKMYFIYMNATHATITIAMSQSMIAVVI
jgi:hypothetical protein